MKQNTRTAAKKEVQRAEIALHRMRAKAAALLAPEHTKQSSYMYRTLRHRDTGVRVRVLDTQAPDAPAGLFDLPLRFVVECETHGGSPQSFASLGAAMGAARRSYEWCDGCARLMGPQATARMREGVRAARRRRSRVKPRPEARVGADAARSGPAQGETAQGEMAQGEMANGDGARGENAPGETGHGHGMHLPELHLHRHGGSGERGRSGGHGGQGG